MDTDGGDSIGRLREAIRRLAEFNRERTPTGVPHDDADEVVGTMASDDAFGFDPFPLLRALDDAGARVVVMGQVAGILHGSTELTGDLDLLWDGDVVQAPALAAAFARVGAVLTDDSGVVVPCAAQAFTLPKVQFRSPSASGDCCTPALPWGDLPVTRFLGRCQMAVADDGTVVRYLNRDDLIRMRLAVGRVKDLRRVEELQRAP
ncbi:hypothetical protein [Actinopolymorpha alba]|uniref:hypothetical protein n=1 Tax=Actinopolymorpha alba TaxID=533267 RepID=UPI00037A08EF|nr:hypothetical protein [Actinopolymorpha alba]